MSLVKSVHLVATSPMRRGLLTDNMVSRIYRGLSARQKLAVGAGLLAWGTVGLYMSDRAEEKFGFTPSEQENAALEQMKPKIRVVDRDDRS